MFGTCLVADVPWGKESDEIQIPARLDPGLIYPMLFWCGLQLYVAEFGS